MLKKILLLQVALSLLSLSAWATPLSKASASTDDLKIQADNYCIDQSMVVFQLETSKRNIYD